MGWDVGEYKNGYNTWLSSRLQNQPRSFLSFRLIFSLFSPLFCRRYAFSLVGSVVLIHFCKAFVGWAWSLSLGSYPDFLHIFPHRGFSGRFFLASVLTAFALLAVAQLYEIFKTLVRFLLVFLYFRFILYFIYIVCRS